MPRSSIPSVWGSIQRFEYCPTLFLFASNFIYSRWRMACLGCFLFSLVCFVWGNPCGMGSVPIGGGRPFIYWLVPWTLWVQRQSTMGR